MKSSYLNKHNDEVSNSPEDDQLPVGIWITIFKCLNHSIQKYENRSVFLLQNNRLNVHNKLQYTFGWKFSVFGYSYPNRGINQSELANESRDFIIQNSLCLFQIRSIV